MSDRGLYAPWLYAKIVSLGWHPFMRINKQGNFRPHGEAKFRSLATAAPEVGSAWCGVVDCFSSEVSRLQCTLLAQWDEGYEEMWLIVTDLAPAQATAVWYGMRSWIEGGFKDTKRGGWDWHQTKMVDPERVERLWLAIAVATLWGGKRGRRSRCKPAREQFGGVAPNAYGSSYRYETCAPTHAELFCTWHHHDCRNADPR